MLDLQFLTDPSLSSQPWEIVVAGSYHCDNWRFLILPLSQCNL